MKKEKDKKDLEKRIAYKEHIVTDMGNGGAFCSHCQYDLGSDPVEIYKIHKCPGCGYTLYEGGFAWKFMV
ncbi:MAG: hypothetical protein QME12_08325 [Nanoarchaeota archaeon]|nr:hypothetical protein [Nanoarchaeota archaeon]